MTAINEPKSKSDTVPKCLAAFLITSLIAGMSYSIYQENRIPTPAEQAKKLEQRQLIWIETSKEAVRDQLKDPQSAEFRNVFFKQSDLVPMVCGEVNSRNSFGGMAGFQRFVASGGDLVILEEGAKDFNKGWAKVCEAK